MVIDYFESVDGQPLILLINYNKKLMKDEQLDLKLPSHYQIVKDITDAPEYMAKAMAQKDYVMNE